MFMKMAHILVDSCPGLFPRTGYLAVSFDAPLDPFIDGCPGGRAGR
jgi:hypothetical protein